MCHFFGSLILPRPNCSAHTVQGYSCYSIHPAELVQCTQALPPSQSSAQAVRHCSSTVRIAVFWQSCTPGHCKGSAVQSGQDTKKVTHFPSFILWMIYLKGVIRSRSPSGHQFSGTRRRKLTMILNLPMALFSQKKLEIKSFVIGPNKGILCSKTICVHSATST